MRIIQWLLKCEQSFSNIEIINVTMVQYLNSSEAIIIVLWKKYTIDCVINTLINNSPKGHNYNNQSQNIYETKYSMCN